MSNWRKEEVEPKAKLLPRRRYHYAMARFVRVAWPRMRGVCMGQLRRAERGIREARVSALYKERRPGVEGRLQLLLIKRR